MGYFDSFPGFQDSAAIAATGFAIQKLLGDGTNSSIQKGLILGFTNYVYEAALTGAFNIGGNLPGTDAVGASAKQTFSDIAKSDVLQSMVVGLFYMGGTEVVQYVWKDVDTRSLMKQWLWATSSVYGEKAIVKPMFF